MQLVCVLARDSFFLRLRKCNAPSHVLEGISLAESAHTVAFVFGLVVAWFTRVGKQPANGSNTLEMQSAAGVVCVCVA